MKWRVAAIAAVMGMLLATGPATAADQGHQLIVVLDRTGQAVFDIGQTPIDPSFEATPRSGVVAFALEKLGKDATALDTRFGVAARRSDGEQLSIVVPGASGLDGGQYLLSSLVTGSSARLVIPVPGLTHDRIIRLSSTGVAGAAALLPLTDGVHTASAQVSRPMNNPPTARAFSIAAIITNGSAGTVDLCFTHGQQTCPSHSLDPMLPRSTRIILSGATSLPPLRAVASFTGVGTGSVWGVATVIPAPLRR